MKKMIVPHRDLDNVEPFAIDLARGVTFERERKRIVAIRAKSLETWRFESQNLSLIELFNLHR